MVFVKPDLKEACTKSIGEMHNTMNQQEQFLSDVKSDSPIMDDKAFQDLFDGKKDPQAEKPEPEKDEEYPNTRKYRRLQDRLKKSEEMQIALNERIKELSALQKFSKEHPEVDPDEVKIFGTDEQGKLLKSYFDRRFESIKEEAERSALEKFQSEISRDAEEEARNSQMIDDAFDNIEEKYGVDLSGDTPQSKKLRNGFIDFMEEISPKDANGEITEYADFDSAFNTYNRLASSAIRETSNRQKELASRSMTRSGVSQPEMPKGPITFKTVGRMLDNLRDQ